MSIQEPKPVLSAEQAGPNMDLFTLPGVTPLEELKPYEIAPIGADPESQAKRGWDVYINGELVADPVESVRLVNDRMGRNVEYGQRPEGFDGVGAHEPGGGGAVTIQHFVAEDERGFPRLFSSTAIEFRGPMGGTVANVPRGFLDPGQTHKQAAQDETRMETGQHVEEEKITQLGVAVNANSDMYNTAGVTADGQREGVRLYEVQVPRDQVEPHKGADGRTYYTFTAEVADRAGDKKSHERIERTVFVPIETVETPDMFTEAAASRLFKRFIRDGHMTLNIAGVQDPRQEA
jgi:ADP-ribose pyrophosphatase YjhB (NUDIX family)